MSTVTSDAKVPTEVQAEAQKNSQDALFRWSAWVHVGAGAEDCPDARTGKCADTEHFHAWCRLPNPFQVRDIQEKAAAAQARYKKLLRDPSTDQACVMEEELSDLATYPLEVLVDEAVDKHFPDDYTAAVRLVDDLPDDTYEMQEGDEESDVPRKWAGIDQDREEWNRQRVLPEEERTPDFPQMEANITEYGEALQKQIAQLQDPRRDEYMQSPREELEELARRERIENKATEVYLHWYNTWQWLACTLKPRPDGMPPNERVWRDINDMKQNAPAPVISALRSTFDRLESNLAASRRGKGS